MKNIFTTQRGSFTRAIKLFLLTLILAIGFATDAGATHFRYHSTSWSVGSPNVVTFQIAQSWRWSAFANPGLGTIVNTGSWDNGDGSFSNLDLTVTSVNPTDDWFTGVTTITHTYSGPGTYVANYNSCCRISTLLDGNNDNSERIATSVTLGGIPQNNSPVTLVPAIVNMQLNNPNSFTIPGFDPDGDALTFSITPSAESFLNVASPTGLTLSPSGTITWTPTVSGLYALSVKVTDSKGDYTMVDFIMNVSASTSNPPTFNYAVTPANNFVYSVNPGTPINFNVEANDVDAGAQVTLSASGVPSGASFTPSLPVTSNPVTTSFSWTPGNADLGSYIIALTATDNNSQQATTNIIINVNTNPVFDYPPTPPAGTGFCIMTGVPFSQLVQSQNLVSTANVSITGMTGLPVSATTSPAIPTPAAAIATTTLNWTPAVSDWGPHTVTFTATDVNNKTATTNFNLLVNTSPVFTSPAPSSSATVGVLYTHALSGTDANVPYGDALNFESTGLPAWLTLTDNGNGTGSLSGTPPATGTFTFDIILEDIYHHCGPVVSQTVTLNVGNGSSNDCSVNPTPSVLNINVTNITGISASINYDPIGNIGWYELRWRKVGTTSWIIGTNYNFNTKLLTGLTPNTAYEVQCRGFCSVNGPSGPWTTLNFSTNGLCSVPTGLNANPITANSAKLNWTAVPGVPFYTIRWKKTSLTTWSNSTSIGTSKTVFGLSPSTSYDFQVRSNCGSSAGAWSSTSTFTTAALKGGESLSFTEVTEDNLKVYPNPTQQELNVEYVANETMSTTLKIVDMSGRILKQVQMSAEEGINNFTMDISSLSNGIYILQVYSSEKLHGTTRVIKN